MLSCAGCKSPLDSPDPARRLCPDCRAAMYEGLARRFNPSYDPAVPNAWEACSAALSRLYGKDWEMFGDCPY
jgi:hypothetical protein